MKTIKELLCLTEHECFLYVEETLSELGIAFYSTEHYIVTDIHMKRSPLVCVHLDTVSPIPPTEGTIVEKDRTLSLRKNTTAKCLGADDRAGVWIALEMLRLGTKSEFEYGFFRGEESGGIGSREFAESCDIDDMYSCFIGLDRGSKNGVQNVAEYDYDNAELLQCFVERGFVASFGTFSDCSNLSSNCTLACVNLSVGYISEHTSKEKLYLDLMENTLDVMLEVEIKSSVYKADPRPVCDLHNWRNYSKVTKVTSGMPICCDLCGRHDRLFMRDGEQLCEGCIDVYARNENELQYY